LKVQVAFGPVGECPPAHVMTVRALVAGGGPS
jgi:hypothetical protein